MPTQITLITELSRERLLELRDQIDALLGPAPAVSSGPATPSTTAGSVDDLVSQLRARLNNNLQSFVKFLVDRYSGREFIWDDVARDMHRELGTIKSWHRSVSKPLNRIGAANPSAPALLTSRWDGSRNHYTLSSEWKEVIARTWV